MTVQVQHGVLLQFADDNDLMCCGDSNEDTSRLLMKDLALLSQWISVSQIKINVTV